MLLAALMQQCVLARASCPELKLDLHEVPLHITYALEQDINLSDFISHPLAVSMLVDTFMSSHGKLTHS